MNCKVKQGCLTSESCCILLWLASSARLPFIFLLSQKEYPSRQHTAQRKQYSH